jgi:hypothetical protein
MIFTLSRHVMGVVSSLPSGLERSANRHGP